MISAVTHKLPIFLVMEDKFYITLPTEYMATANHSQPPFSKPGSCIHR